jgi:hypothetical protein
MCDKRYGLWPVLSYCSSSVRSFAHPTTLQYYPSCSRLWCYSYYCLLLYFCFC